MRLLRSEWTKFRTVRGWVVGMIVAIVAIVALGLGPGMHGSCGTRGPASACTPTTGPGGEEVTDSLTFLHRPLVGDGSITARITSVTGLVPAVSHDRGGTPTLRPDLVPWAKAGLSVKASTSPGSAYAAVMLTGSHGVRMQYDYTHDIAGPAGTVSPGSPRWLRLTRTGDTVAGSVSQDGSHWNTIATARLTGLPSTVEVGMFATSPQYTEAVDGFLMSGDASAPSQATATFDQVRRQGNWPERAWVGEHIGGPDNAGPLETGGYRQVGDEFTVSGSGDIGPSVSGAAGNGTTLTQTLVGTFAGLLAVVVIGAVFMSGEYRRGLIRTTLAASPRRGQVLAAKAGVLAAVSFVAGVVSAAVVVAIGPSVLRGNGVYVHPATLATQLRLVAGTGALLAVAAVLALSIGAVLRRSATSVAAVIVVVVLPYLLAISGLPLGAARWVLRVTPAAAFAVQQSAVQYAQVDNVYSPTDGFFPLAPWAGFAVLCLWTAAALGVATAVLRRRDS